jgi:hypothetical protein
MRPNLKFILVLVVGLAALSVAGAVVVTRTVNSWFERDLELRANLAVTGARNSFVAHWRRAESDGLRDQLTELARDERIMSGVVCTRSGAALASTPDFPAEFTCAELLGRVAPAAERPAWVSSTTTRSIQGGRVHLSIIPVYDGAAPLGFVARGRAGRWHLERRAAEADALAPPARRAGDHRGQPRAVHPRA